MQRAKRFFYFFLGLIGLLLVGITIFIILLQYKTEINLPLSIFCILSWILFIFALFQALLQDKEYNYAASENSLKASILSFRATLK
jgi:O-antigen/teichoic acid export membrane protein